MSNGRGFSTIELVTVLLLISLVSVNAVVRVPSSNFTLAAETDQLLEHVRYAQFLAISMGSRVKLSFSGNGYSMTDLNGNTLTFPDYNSNTITLPAGHSLSASHVTLVYDEMGRPYTDANLPGNPLTGVASYNLVGEGYNYTVNILQETGKADRL